MKIKIGLQLAPMFGEYKNMRKRWMEAEALGVDALYSADHFFAHAPTEAVANNSAKPLGTSGENFEGTTIEAAMAATTTRPEIGCIVHANSFRNPNLLADIARTLDHISDGRYILGIGSGYMQEDYKEYGYEFGTATSRMLDLKRNLPIIKARLGLLNPPPIRKIPILIGAMGEKIGMRIVAEHANIWQMVGPPEYLGQKIELMKTYCRDIGRDFNEIELCAYYFPHILKTDTDPNDFLKLGIGNIVNVVYGPEWDLGMLKDLLRWRKRLA